MPVTIVSGDPLLTQAQTLAFGYNARGKTEFDTLAAVLSDRYPAAFASFGKQARHGRLAPGDLWLWTQSQPRLLFMVVRETAVGITRLRYVEAAVMTLARDYPLYAISSLALVPLGNRQEWPFLKPVVESWLSRSRLDVTLYEAPREASRSLE